MSRYDLGRAEIAGLLADEPAYRTEQLWQGLYRRFAEPLELTELPSTLRARLASNELLGPGLDTVEEVAADNGETIKWLFRLAGDAMIETVLMHHPRHSTVCVSSQAGCAMGCTFCATGRAGYLRQLSAGEIIEQIVRAARRAQDHGRRLSHVVFMGMGEPLANLDAVLEAVDRATGSIGLAARHLTISTVGVVPGIERLAREAPQLNLAVSLHAANDTLRNELVPLNRRYPLDELMDACAHYVAATHRRLSFEWALIDGVNDRDADAVELAGLAGALRAHVNLIPLNPIELAPGETLRAPSTPRIRAFRDALVARGIRTTIRRTRGRTIDAACGQLARTGALARPRRRSTAREPLVPPLSDT